MWLCRLRLHIILQTLRFRAAALHRNRPRHSAPSVKFTKATICCSQPKDVTDVMYALVTPANTPASRYLSLSRLTPELRLRAVKFRPVKIFTADHKQT